MKKFLSSASLAALVFTFIPQQSYGMELLNDEPHSGIKRVREENHQRDPETPLENGPPFSTVNFTHEQVKNTILPYTSLHPEKFIVWAHRLINSEWEETLNLYVKKLDLSCRYWNWIPFSKQAEWMNSSTPVVITEQFTFYKGYLKGYFDVEDSDQLSVCWKDKNQTYEDEETVRMQQGSLLMEVDLWKSVVLRIPTDQWDYPFRQNPLLKALPNKGWCSIDIELEKFLNLEKLRLQDNTVISDINLSKSTNLTKLDLKDNSVITDNSLSMLTNLTNLDLNFNSMITDKSICNAYKSEGIRYRV